MLLGPLGQRVALCKTAPGSFVEPAPRVLKPALIQTKRPPLGWSFCLYLVEVAGFEPASANPLPQDLHA